MAEAKRSAIKKNPDAELIALGRQISAVRVRERAAGKECFALLDAADDAALEAAEARADIITAEICALYDRMLKMKPTTLQGYQAFALALVEACWNDEIVDFGPTSDHQGVRAILSGLTGIPLAA